MDEIKNEQTENKEQVVYNVDKPLKKEASERQKRANTLNSMKHGKYSKKIPANAIKYLSNPEEFKKLLEKTIDALEKAELDDKTKIFYLNTLNNTFKTIYGNKNINLNVEIRPDSAKSMHSIYLEVHPELTQILNKHNIVEENGSNTEDDDVNK